MTTVLARRLVAEFTGTGLLVAVVVGSGIAASRLTGDAALRLLVCSLVTAMGLAVLIVVFTPAGGLSGRSADGRGSGRAVPIRDEIRRHVAELARELAAGGDG